jgi:membrane-bound lytic murein transglycosylase D
MRFTPFFIFNLLIFSLTGCQNGHLTTNHSTKSLFQTDEIDFSKADKTCSFDPSLQHVFTPQDYDSVWDRIRAGYKLTQDQNARIQKHLNWYATHPAYISRVSERGSKYLFHIVDQLEAHNMPLELALLPIVESAFDPFAYSHGRASGIWQFIPGTGRQYGLKQDWWYDGRRDIVAATDAAIRYLSRLHKRFDNDWLLALAAYNTGAGNVNKAIRHNKSKGLATDFWSLNLPNETKAYVPQLLALSRIIRSPEQHNVTLTNVPNTPYFEIVDIESQIDLALAANLADITTTDLYRLNPGFNRWATAPQGPHRLLIPLEQAELFKTNLLKLPTSQRVKWQRYSVRPGDSLISIAKKFNTSVKALKDSNKIRGNLIRAGKPLLIPVASGNIDAYAYSSSQRLKRTQDRSKGQSGSTKITYEVMSGDSFWSIAKQHKVTINQLAKWNGMAPKDTLKKNQKLIIWSQQTKSGPTSNSIIRKVAYRVRNGDSLARIAGKFNLSVNDIERWNPVDKSSYIHPGQRLTLFVDVTRIN